MKSFFQNSIMFKKIYNQIDWLKLKVSLAASVFLIIFHTTFENLINTVLVNQILKDIDDNSWTNNSLFIVLNLGIIVFYVDKAKKKHIPSFHFLIQLVIACGFYFYYRNCANTWDLFGFSCCNYEIYYLDFLFIWVLFYFLFSLRFWLIQENEALKEGLFISEDSENLPQKDLLGRENYAERIASEIIKVKSKKAFAIGINAKWGSGKTFFLSLIEKHLPKDTITINFNPWESRGSNLIISDFFQALSSKLNEYNSEFSGKINNYVKGIVPSDGGFFESIINQGLEVLSGNVEYEDIDKEIERLNKKIVVFIDDLDRLNNNEILEVIRLIRNTANFGNTIFVVAYDRDYIINALEEQNNHLHEFFLEKIFQLEIPLPIFEASKLDVFFLKLMKEKMKDDKHYPLLKNIITEQLGNRSLIAKYLPTIRDVVRYSNLFALDYSFVKGEIDLKDFFFVQILKLKYPNVYEWIYTNRNIFFTTMENGSLISYVYIKDDEGLNTLKKEIDERPYIFNIPKENKDIAINIIEDFLQVSYINRPYISMKRLSSIQHKSSFHKYFTPELFSSDLSENEFIKCMKLDIKTIKIQITEWIALGKNYRLVERLRISDKTNSIWYDTKKGFEKMIEIHFYMINENRYLFEDLYSKLYNRNNQITDRYYDGKNNLYKLFIVEMFKRYTPVDFARFLLRQKDHSFILKEDELRKTILEEFENFLIQENTKKEKNWNYIWNLYHANHFPNKREEDALISQDANDIFINFILNDNFLEFLSKLVYHEFRIDKYVVGSIVKQIFGSYSNFEKVLLEQSDKYENNSFYKEFLDFYTAFKENDYYGIEDYKFQVIQIKN